MSSTLNHEYAPPPHCHSAQISLLLPSSKSQRTARHGAERLPQSPPDSSTTLVRVWKHARESTARDCTFESPLLMRRTGRRRIALSRALEKLRGVDQAARSSVRAAAAINGLTPATLYRPVTQGKLEVATTVAKPLLTTGNRQQRLSFCLNIINPTTFLYGNMFDIIHSDRNLFYTTDVWGKVYLRSGNPRPLPVLKSKRFVPEVMMLVAVARPRRYLLCC